MSVLGHYTKQPREIETYSIDYGDDLTENDNLETIDVSVEGSDNALTIVSSWLIDAPGDRRARVRVSGGTNRVKYKITVLVVTADGRTLEDEFYVTVKDY